MWSSITLSLSRPTFVADFSPNLLCQKCLMNDNLIWMKKVSENLTEIRFLYTGVKLLDRALNTGLNNPQKFHIQYHVGYFNERNIYISISTCYLRYYSYLHFVWKRSHSVHEKTAWTVRGWRYHKLEYNLCLPSRYLFRVYWTKDSFHNFYLSDIWMLTSFFSPSYCNELPQPRHFWVI